MTFFEPKSEKEPINDVQNQLFDISAITEVEQDSIRESMSTQEVVDVIVADLVNKTKELLQLTV